MTELTEPDHPTAQPAPEWPQAPGHDIRDPQVAQATARLFDLPGLPAAEHETIYTVLHDELLAALNSEPADSEPADGQPAGTDPKSSEKAGGAA